MCVCLTFLNYFSVCTLVRIHRYSIHTYVDQIYCFIIFCTIYYIRTYVQRFFCMSFAANKVPILIFSGHIDGTVLKWERLQLNTFLYSHEQFVYKDKLMEALQREKNELCGGQPLIGTDPKQGILEKLYKEKVKHALEVSIQWFREPHPKQAQHLWRVLT